MALIFCGKCQNEYDNNLPVCPYCNYPTPTTEGLKNKFPALIIIGIVVLLALPFLITDREDDLKDWFSDVTGYEFSQNSSGTVVDDEVIATELQSISSQADPLARYVRSANTLLNSVSTKTAIPETLLQDTSARTLEYTIYKNAVVQVALTNDGSAIEHVVVSNINNRAYKKDMQNIVAALFAAVQPSSISMDDAKSQLTYLHQIALESPGCSVYYNYEGYYLAESYNPDQKVLSISLSRKAPDGGC